MSSINYDITIYLVISAILVLWLYDLYRIENFHHQWCQGVTECRPDFQADERMYVAEEL